MHYIDMRRKSNPKSDARKKIEHEKNGVGWRAKVNAI